jgi:hypothetical protein
MIMTTTIASATLAALLLGAGATATAPTVTSKTVIPKTTVKLDPSIAKPILPKFSPLLSKDALVKGAKDKKVVPTSSNPPLTTLATLSAANMREGGYVVDFICANVYASWAADGIAAWPSKQLEFCREHMDAGEKAGIEVVFPAEAGKAYAVECNGSSGPMWRIRHKIGAGSWSAVASIATQNPIDYVIATTTGEARVRFVLDPQDNNVLRHDISTCRVSRIG